jgi:hypothetical protein
MNDRFALHMMIEKQQTGGSVQRCGDDQPGGYRQRAPSNAQSEARNLQEVGMSPRILITSVTY